MIKVHDSTLRPIGWIPDHGFRPQHGRAFVLAPKFCGDDIIQCSSSDPSEWSFTPVMFTWREVIEHTGIRKYIVVHASGPLEEIAGFESTKA